MQPTQWVTGNLADSSALLLVSEDGQELVPVEMRHVDASRVELVNEALRARYRLGEGIAGRVWRTERGILIPVVDTQALEETAHTQTRHFIRTTHLRSLMAVPLVREGRVVGVLTAARDEGSPSFTEADYESLIQFAASADLGARS